MLKREGSMYMLQGNRGARSPMRSSSPIRQRPSTAERKELESARARIALLQKENALLRRQVSPPPRASTSQEATLQGSPTSSPPQPNLGANVHHHVAQPALLAPPPSRASPELYSAPLEQQQNEEACDAAPTPHSKPGPSPDAEAQGATPEVATAYSAVPADELQVPAKLKAVADGVADAYPGAGDNALTVQLESPDVTMRPSMLGSDVGYGAVTPL